MTLVGCDLHSRKQQVAVLDTTTGEVLEQELAHDGDTVERCYRGRPSPSARTIAKRLPPGRRSSAGVLGVIDGLP